MSSDEALALRDDEMIRDDSRNQINRSEKLTREISFNSSLSSLVDAYSSMCVLHGVALDFGRGTALQPRQQTATQLARASYRETEDYSRLQPTSDLRHRLRQNRETGTDRDRLQARGLEKEGEEERNSSTGSRAHRKLGSGLGKVMNRTLARLDPLMRPSRP